MVERCRLRPCCRCHCCVALLSAFVPPPALLLYLPGLAAARVSCIPRVDCCVCASAFPRKLAAATDCARETRALAATRRPRPRTATPTAVPIVPGPFACAVEEGEAR